MLLSVPGKVFSRIFLEGVLQHLLERHAKAVGLYTKEVNDADESFARGCSQPMFISTKCLIQ